MSTECRLEDLDALNGAIRPNGNVDYAFEFLHVSKQPEAAVAVLHNDVLPFYANLDLPVKAVLTDNGREFCGTERHPYELYLDLNGIEHRRTKVGTPKTNGFVERFNGMVLDEFFRIKMRETFYDSVGAMQADLDAWLIHYNTERPHLGYRNMGRRPIETVMSFVSQEGYGSGCHLPHDERALSRKEDRHGGATRALPIEASE